MRLDGDLVDGDPETNNGTSLQAKDVKDIHLISKVKAYPRSATEDPGYHRDWRFRKCTFPSPIR